jgi:hypothetical protein
MLIKDINVLEVSDAQFQSYEKDSSLSRPISDECNSIS